MPRLSRPAAVFAVLALGLAGCGAKNAEATAKGPAATPATGTTITSKYFSYKAPEGWEKPAKSFPGLVGVAGDTNDHDGFTDNINVVRIAPATILGTKAIETASVKELKSAHATHIETLAPQDIDGDDAAHVTSVGALTKGTYIVEQFAVVHDKASYVITFSFSPDVPRARQSELSQSVLATWHWAD